MCASAPTADHVARTVVGDSHADNGFQGDGDGGVGSLFGELLFLHDAEETALFGRKVVQHATYTAQRSAVVTLAEIKETGVPAAIEAGFP